MSTSEPLTRRPRIGPGEPAGVTEAVPRIVGSGVGPLIVEYIDLMTMAALTANVGLDLGVPQGIKDTAQRIDKIMAM